VVRTLENTLKRFSFNNLQRLLDRARTRTQSYLADAIHCWRPSFPPSFVAVPRATRLPSCFHWRTIVTE
jgi:hypothetical protein